MSFRIRLSRSKKNTMSSFGHGYHGQIILYKLFKKSRKSVGNGIVEKFDGFILQYI